MGKMDNYSLLRHKIYPNGISMMETAKYFCGAKIVINLHRSYNDKTLFNKIVGKLSRILLIHAHLKFQHVVRFN